jgi:hypothetical protein
MRAGGISPDIVVTAAQDIENEFRQHRPWHKEVTCSFSNGTLILVATNDFDRNGFALSDEFSDCLSAYIPLDKMSRTGPFEVVAVEVIGAA